LYESPWQFLVSENDNLQATINWRKGSSDDEVVYTTSLQRRESDGNGVALLWQRGDRNLCGGGAISDENRRGAMAAVQQQFPG